jgi:hypothetical protein
MALKRGTETPTIDVALVTITTKIDGVVDKEYAIDTASKIGVSPELETQDAVKLVIKGSLKAQKRKTSTLVGHTITLTDNVFIPEVVQILQGGTLTMGTGEAATTVIKYEPPVAGTTGQGTEFELSAYSAIYNTAGVITGYEKITYPGCKGDPVALNSEDNVFRAAEYTIFSAATVGAPPYTLDYVAALPAIV